MASKANVPDAWDDDWESRADTAQTTEDIIETLPKLSKAERRAKQAELNRRLWEEAEAPKNNFYLDTKRGVPLQTEFKPAVKVLSRQPAPTVIAKKDPISGVEKLTLEKNDQDDDDDDDEEMKPKPLTIEERQAKAQKEREEKQRKYEEARQRLFGTPSPASGSASHSPHRGTVSPSMASSDKNRGRNKGSGRPASTAAKSRQLYDPHSPGSDAQSAHKQKNATSRSAVRSGEEEKIVRQPRGPDGTGRGGNGFDRPRKQP